MQQVDLLFTSPPDFDAAEAAPEGVELRFGRLDRAVPGNGLIWAIIDWTLDNEAGVDRCRALRADPRYARSHLVMLLEDDSVDRARQALAAGANDVVVAPLTAERLCTLLDDAIPDQARINLGSRIQNGPLMIDCDAIQARWNGRLVKVPLNEFRLLHFLGLNANRVLSRSELIAGLGKKDQPIDERTVDVWIARLRRALNSAGAGDVIRTVRPLGYVLDID